MNPGAQAHPNVDGAALALDLELVRAARRLRDPTSSNEAAKPLAPAMPGRLLSTGHVDPHESGGGNTLSFSSAVTWKSFIAVGKRAVTTFLADDVLTLAAALTFSTLLSFAPLMLLALWLTTALGSGAQDALLNQLAALAGNDARVAAQAVIDSASKRPALGSVAGLFGLAVALVGATSVLAQLQTSLNDIWHIKAKPVRAVWGWLRRRILSVGLLGSTGFVLSISLVVSAGLGMMLSGTGVLWDIINQLITAGVFAVLFAGLFRYLPDARLPWRLALGGGAVTALLFALGKWLIGLYLARGNVGGAYGAAGSLVVLLVWVYYSSAIFFFGAELVGAWLKEHRRETGAESEVTPQDLVTR